MMANSWGQEVAPGDISRRFPNRRLVTRRRFDLGANWGHVARRVIARARAGHDAMHGNRTIGLLGLCPTRPSAKN